MHLYLHLYCVISMTWNCNVHMFRHNHRLCNHTFIRTKEYGPISTENVFFRHRLLSMSLLGLQEVQEDGGHVALPGARMHGRSFYETT